MDESFEYVGMTLTSSNNNDESFVGAQEKIMTCRSGDRRVLQVGLDHWLDQKELKPLEGVSRVIFMVPGNPGEILFYKFMMERLHQQLGLPVIGASHAGLSRRCARRSSGPLTVRKLVDDEIEFIEEWIPSCVEIILIGHSIGAFIVKEIMKVSEDRQRFVHSVLLCPALQSLGSTPGGYVVGVLQYIPFLLYIPIALLSLLPDRQIRMIITAVFDLLFDYTDCAVSAATELAHVPSIRNALILADDEFNQVQDLDEKFIEKNEKRLSLVYADKDEWVPRKYFNHLKDLFPEIAAVVIPKTLHTFCFSERMTEDFVRVISNTLNKFKKS